MNELAIGISGTPIPVPSGIPTGGLPVLLTVLGRAISIIIAIAILLLIFNLLYAGIQWITSEGDKTKVASARSRITYGIIGLLVIILSYLIIGIIGRLLGTPLLKFS